MIRALLLILTLSLTSFAVEFLVPDSSAKYDLIDSLYTTMTGLETHIQSIEKGLIKDKSVKDINSRISYLDYLIEYRLQPLTKIQAYKKMYREYLECKRTYFQELLTVLEDDSRVSCFILYKKARDDLATFEGYLTQ
jgi:hypothetical protein